MPMPNSRTYEATHYQLNWRVAYTFVKGSPATYWEQADSDEIDIITVELSYDNGQGQPWLCITELVNECPELWQMVYNWVDTYHADKGI